MMVSTLNSTPVSGQTDSLLPVLVIVGARKRHETINTNNPIAHMDAHGERRGSGYTNPDNMT